ncbi:MAG: glycoside hydrolase family 130 protein [Opitutales bacterium]
MKIKRHSLTIVPARDRVLIRPFLPTEERAREIADRVLALSAREVARLLANVERQFSDRHFDIESVFRRNFEAMRSVLPQEHALSEKTKLLLGSYFSSEYALESAALFNPSIIAHPDQSGVPSGSIRFIMSLRATGEGHISSIEFRSGVINRAGHVTVVAAGDFVTEPTLVPDPAYDKALFALKLDEMRDHTSVSDRVLAPLPEQFSRSQLLESIQNFKVQLGREFNQEQERSISAIRWLAESNYEVRFDPDIQLSERIIFPASSNESNGIEDARFVRFTDNDGEVTYYATYTAYNGQAILPQMLETKDFLHFDIRTLNGPAAQNKGMALFPRRINGRYAMIGRQDNQNLFLMSSDHPHFWYDADKILGPEQPWEFVQMGNCGSPIETDHGWLLLTHGVGPMRRYCVGAVLLDLKDPSRVIGRLKKPLLEPKENEREGYVPNVIYTCGGMLHNGTLFIPYAMSDYASSMASVRLDELLNAMA